MSAIPNLDGSSRIYAVFGDPVDQVQTPGLINPLFARRNANVIAVPFRIGAARFDAAWDVFASVPNVAGLGITVPHKIAAAKRCDRLTAAAADVYAVNCVRREPDGTMHGALFDGIGFVRGLDAERVRLQGATVLLVGAGGAGRTIAHALSGEGVGRLHVVDIDEDAARFAADLVNRTRGGTVAMTQPLDVSVCDLLINATPAGLEPGDSFPVSLAGLRAETLVADIASLSRETELLATARQRGCTVFDGKAMLEAQIELVAGFILGLPEGTPIGGAEAPHGVG